MLQDVRPDQSPALPYFAYFAEDDDIELSIMLDEDMQSFDIIEDMPLELLLIADELDIIELSIDELGGQAIEELDIIELSIMLDEDAPAAKPGTTWAAKPPVANNRAMTASCFFKMLPSWLNVPSTSP